jgi:hypothetical protein
MCHTGMFILWEKWQLFFLQVLSLSRSDRIMVTQNYHNRHLSRSDRIMVTQNYHNRHLSRSDCIIVDL